MKNTVCSFKKAKENGEKLTMLTAYDYSTAKLIDESNVNGILVGDSLGMVCLGYENTLMVTMDDMIHHIKAVSRGVKEALVVGDMPFMSYHTSTFEAVKNAGRFIQEAGAHAVKLEGGFDVIDKVQAIVKAQIPVMGHLGLTPQSVNMMGGFKVQGKDEKVAKKILEEAKALEEAGVFAIVLECVPAPLSKLITENISIPTIGIGAGSYCDGQILVYQDMLNMFPGMRPKFVKVFEDIGELMKKGFKQYVDQVKEGSFPEKMHSFMMDESIIEKLY